MAMPAYVKLERIRLDTHSMLNERWVQDRIAEDPSVLGFGDLVLKDKERIQPRAGRLDLLLQEADANRRYEVEVQLGATDESHIIRTIEYWDLERKRYPQYEHCAVLVAEDITSRFLNVIGLFNGTIPFVAIQMQALQVRDEVTLVFTTVMDELPRGLVEADEDEREITDRAYWESRGAKNAVPMMDQLFVILRGFDPTLELKYTKFYIGLAKAGQPKNFIKFRPRKNGLLTTLRLRPSPDVQAKLDESGLETLDYDKREGYRVRLVADDLANRLQIIEELMARAFQEA